MHFVNRQSSALIILFLPAVMVNKPICFLRGDRAAVAAAASGTGVEQGDGSSFHFLPHFAWSQGSQGTVHLINYSLAGRYVESGGVSSDSQVNTPGRALIFTSKQP